MRRFATTALFAAVAVAVLGAVLVVGLRQADDAQNPDGGAARTSLSRDVILPALAEAPAPLARLHVRGGTLDGSGVDAFSRDLKRLRGYPVVVNVWATWCAPCKREFPLFQRASRDLGTSVAFLGVNNFDSEKAARAFLKRFFVPYPSIEDQRGLIRESFGGGTGLPITVFYTADGKRNHVQQGEYASLADLKSDIERYAVKG